MKLKNQYLVAGLLAAVTTAGLVVASPDEMNDRDSNYKQRGPLPFEVYDQNGDGVVSAEEFADIRAARAADREQRMAEKRAKRFDAMDTDDDGMISLEEYTAQRVERQHKRGCKGMGSYWSS